MYLGIRIEFDLLQLLLQSQTQTSGQIQIGDKVLAFLFLLHEHAFEHCRVSNLLDIVFSR